MKGPNTLNDIFSVQLIGGNGCEPIQEILSLCETINGAVQAGETWGYPK